MKPFTKNELISIGVILSLIFILSFVNFVSAIRRARDSQRRQDLGTIANALGKYQQEFRFFPLSSAEGKIKACKGADFENFLEELSQDSLFNKEKYLDGLGSCEWGQDSLADLTDPQYPAYLSSIPPDPKQADGLSYYYLSDGSRFQIYAYLEGGQGEPGYNTDVIQRNLNCGSEICNFGRAFGQTPLDKSIQEYENELMEQNRDSS